MHLWTLVLALLLDRFVGDPESLWRRTGHPVEWFGWVIETAEKALLRPGHDAQTQFRNGIILLCLLIAVGALSGYVVSLLLAPIGIVGRLVEACIISVFLAQKSLFDHVCKVASALQNASPDLARHAVGQIVGRDTEGLSRSGIACAAIESLAENYSDGVVAPVFWYALFGLPGMIVYKMINTADSMIGHRSETYLYFGRATARTDDFLNWIPARLTAGLLAIAALFAGGGQSPRRILGQAMRDAGLHVSPNAGWPETAMAAACDIALGGPRKYRSIELRLPYLNAAGRSKPKSADVHNALTIAHWAGLLLLGSALVIAILFTLA